MKKIYIVFAILSVLLASCKKDGKNPSKPDPETPDNSGKVYAVNFNVGANSPSANNAGLKTLAIGDLKDVATRLQYYVYDNTGKQITTLIQNSYDPSFGKITDTFSAGEYTIVIWAAYGTPKTTEFRMTAEGRDVFYKKFTLTVTPSSSAITQDVNLERVVGQLQVTILDSIPPNAFNLTVTVVNDYQFSIKGGVPVSDGSYPTSRYTSFQPSDIGKVNYFTRTQVMNTIAPFSVKIKCTSKTGDILLDVTVKDVVCKPNTRTVLSGELFKNPKASFQVTYNTDWDPDTDVIDF